MAMGCSGKFIDIGANLLDPVFSGTYHGTQRHESDFEAVLLRSSSVGCNRIILTAGMLSEATEAIELIKSRSDNNDTSNSDSSEVRLYSTVGVHPTRCDEFKVSDITAHIEKLHSLIVENPNVVVAVGELGLDYDRLNFCSKEQQMIGFKAQLELARRTSLPLFLHNRNCDRDLLEVLKQNREMWEKGGGVVHSFDGSADLAREFIELGLYSGLNGCSLKTAENLEVIKTIPSNRILLETDAPWCDIRATHAGHHLISTKFESKKEKKFEMGITVKNRQEPCHIVQVLEVVAGARGEVSKPRDNI